uniref:rRNA maturation RNase YbeY n=1 Tax=Pararhizobium sp. IMCC3301 TaxID=3067904 RepID=UPI0027404ED0|nr:rRNA maturation RNase YbeY [Pararhizobium sp. IMCC3301]
MPDGTAPEPEPGQFRLNCVAGDPRWQDVPDPAGLCARVAQACQPVINYSGALEATVLLTDDAQVQDLNARFRNQDKPTNVLSFANEDEQPDADSGALYLGDIAISYDTVLREADETGKSLQDHLTHLIVHGVLHLAGFDHEDDAEAEDMEGQEVEILLGLGIVDPYMAV